jgi:hypothetical protein
MKSSRLNIALCLTAGLVLSGGLMGCNGNKAHDEASAECKAVKDGVTTPNKVCVVNNDDPVNPKVQGVAWKGQTYGLCCPGCKKQWENMTDAQKDAAVSKAMAMSK